MKEKEGRKVNNFKVGEKYGTRQESEKVLMEKN